MNPIDLKEKSIHGSEAFPVACYLSHWNIPYQWHPEDELIFLKEGQLTYNINGESFLLKAGDCIFCPGSMLHSMFLADYQRVTFYAIVFRRDYLFGQNDPCSHLLSTKAATPCYFDAANPEHKEFLDTMQRLCHITHRKEYGYELETKYLLLYFYRYLLKLRRTQDSPADFIQFGTHMISAIAYIHEHYAEKITVEALAASTGYSVTHFENCFKHYSDMTPVRYVYLFRLKKACELLETTDLPIAVISERCGFSGTSYFIRKFKEVYHTSPLKYRHKEFAKAPYQSLPQSLPPLSQLS